MIELGNMNMRHMTVVVPMNWKKYHIFGIAIAARYINPSKTHVKDKNRALSVANRGLFGKNNSSTFTLKE